MSAGFCVRLLVQLFGSFGGCSSVRHSVCSFKPSADAGLVVCSASVLCNLGCLSEGGLQSLPTLVTDEVQFIQKQFMFVKQAKPSFQMSTLLLGQGRARGVCGALGGIYIYSLLYRN